MTYLLDTNACIELLNERESLIAKKLESVSPQDIRLCSVVKAELFHGAYKSRREKNLELVRLFTSAFGSFPFDDSVAEEYGKLRVAMEQQGNRIGPYDLLIASIALVNDATLVTHNTDEFQRVNGLRIEDWQVD